MQAANLNETITRTLRGSRVVGRDDARISREVRQAARNHSCGLGREEADGECARASRFVIGAPQGNHLQRFATESDNLMIKGRRGNVPRQGQSLIHPPLSIKLCSTP